MKEDAQRRPWLWNVFVLRPHVRKRIAWTGLWALLCALGGAPAAADTVVLKNGRRIEGTVLEYRNRQVKIRTGGRIVVIAGQEIREIRYERGAPRTSAGTKMTDPKGRETKERAVETPSLDLVPSLPPMDEPRTPLRSVRELSHAAAPSFPSNCRPVLRSLFWPGLGQICSGRSREGYALAATFLGFAYLATRQLRQYELRNADYVRTANTYWLATAFLSQLPASDRPVPLLWAGAGLSDRREVRNHAALRAERLLLGAALVYAVGIGTVLWPVSGRSGQSAGSGALQVSIRFEVRNQ